MENYFNKDVLKQQMAEQQKRLSACKTKEDLNALWQGREMLITDKNFWYNHRVEFIEMVGEGDRKDWLMKVKTKYGSFLEVRANQVMIIVQTITTTKKESDIIYNHLKKCST